MGRRGFYATMPGTPARDAEDAIALENDLELRTAKPVEAAALGLRDAIRFRLSGPRCVRCDERPPCDPRGCDGCSRDPTCDGCSKDGAR